MRDLITAYKIVVSDSPGRGRGIFATEFIPAGTVVEESHVVDLGLCVEDGQNSDMPLYFWGTPDNKRYAISLGLASLFNHSDHPNTHRCCDMENSIYVFTTMSDIHEGDELLIDYQDRDVFF